MPETRLDYGLDLGETFNEGLAVDAVWNRSAPKTALQNGVWQVGAVVHSASDEQEEWPENQTIVFPNPARGIVYVLMNDPERQYAIAKVYDYFGRFVFSQAVYNGLNPVELPAHMVSGLYTITLEAAGLERYLKKIIILN